MTSINIVNLSVKKFISQGYKAKVSKKHIKTEVKMDWKEILK